MSTRERLPNRRASTIFDFEAMGMRFTASASRYDDGRFAELFLDNHKAGSSIGTLVRDWFWTINYYMREAYDVIAAWGFEAKTILTWAKNRAGFGDWLRGQTEHCIMATRGKPIVTLTNESTLLHASVRGHSEKPREFYELVERLCPAPRYADLFSRYRHSDKWDCHGDQAPCAQEAAE